MSPEARHAPAVSAHQVVAAGLASTTAAFVTSRFGVAGTLLGAALTAMIITGGSAILKSYLESATANVREAPRKLRERRNRWKAGRTAEPPDTLPGRPDLRDSFISRMRAAMGWFSRLPPLRQRSILLKGLIGGAVAFMLGMGVVYVVEQGIGNSLSCGLWSNCPKGATPRVHLAGGDGTGASPTINLGRAKKNTARPQNGTQKKPLQPQNPAVHHQQNTAPPKQQGLPQARPEPGSNHNPIIPKAPNPVQPQEAPQQQEPVKPGSKQQSPPPQQSPSEGGDKVPSQQGVTSSAGQQSAPSQ